MNNPSPSQASAEALIVTEGLSDEDFAEGARHYKIGAEHIGLLLRQYRREITALQSHLAVAEGAAKLAGLVQDAWSIEAIEGLKKRADLASAQAAVVVEAIKVLEDALAENKTEHGVWFTGATDEALDKLYYLRSNPTSAAQAWITERDADKALIDAQRHSNEYAVRRINELRIRAETAERSLAEARGNIRIDNWESRQELERIISKLKPALAPVGSYSSKSVGEAIDALFKFFRTAEPGSV